MEHAVGDRLSVLGDEVVIRAQGDADGVDATVIEEITPPGGGPPLHRHSREDEALYVLEGRLTLWLGDSCREARQGDAVLLPRGVAHSFRNDGDAPSRILVTIMPAGFEAFFRQVSERGLTPDRAEEVIALAGDYGLEILGPPPE